MNREQFLDELLKEGILVCGSWEENLKRIQELKKYKDMWEEFIYGLAHINMGNYQNPYDGKITGLECVNKIVKRVKQKYFPEEAEKELIRKRLKGLREVTDELIRLLHV